ncbi:MAG: prepilin peptidase [Oscillospiraceae bacterium]
MLYADPFLTVYCCLLAALLGACMGSFLNCAAWRIVHGESVLRGRSHCDACGHVLAVGPDPGGHYLAAHGAAATRPTSRRHVLPRPSRRWCS